MSNIKIINKTLGYNHGYMGEETGYNDWFVGDVVFIEDNYCVIVHYEDGDYYGIYGYVGLNLIDLDNKYDFQLHMPYYQVDDISKYDSCLTLIDIKDSTLITDDKVQEYTKISEYSHYAQDLNIKLNNSKIHIIIFKSKLNGNTIKFKGFIENFNPNGNSVFISDDGELLLVNYDDIIQIYVMEDKINV